MFIKSLQVGFVGLFCCIATAWAGGSAIQGVVKDAKGQPIKNADGSIGVAFDFEPDVLISCWSVERS